MKEQRALEANCKEKGIVERLLEEGEGCVAVVLRVADLNRFAEEVARRTGEELTRRTVSAIRDALGDSMRYCSTEEAMKLLNISRSTLYLWEKKKRIVSFKKGGRNVYLRDDVLQLKSKKSKIE